MGEGYKHARYRNFEETGFLITADGSEDSTINLESLDNYVVLPPLPTALAEQPQTCPVPKALPEEEELSFKEQPLCMAYEESEDNEVQENDEKIDNEIDRIYKHPLKNRRQQIFCHSKNGRLD